MINKRIDIFIFEKKQVHAGLTRRSSTKSNASVDDTKVKTKNISC